MENSGCIEETHHARVKIMYHCCMNAFLMLFCLRMTGNKDSTTLNFHKQTRSLFIGTNCKESTLVRFLYSTVASPLGMTDVIPFRSLLSSDGTVKTRPSAYRSN